MESRPTSSILTRSPRRSESPRKVTHFETSDSLAIIKYWCAELGASKEKTTILKGQHNYDTLLKFLDK